MLKIETEECKIGEVKLSEKCLKQLQEFQQNENADLMEQQRLITETILFLSKRLFGRTPDENPEETTRLISDLAFLQEYLQNLSA